MTAHSPRLILSNTLAGLKARVKPVYRVPVIWTAKRLRERARATRFIAITGSSGKTTTKDLVNAILGEEFPVVCNDDSNNQLYSVARTLLDLRKSTRFVVQEIGASENNEMSDSLALLRPDIGVIVTIGREHHRTFRNREQVAEEKSKIVKCLSADGVAVLNFDVDLLREMSSGIDARVVSFGFSEDCDVKGSEVLARWPDRLSMIVQHDGRRIRCETRFCGEHMAYIVLAALATCVAAGMRLEDAVSRISGVEPTTARMMPYRTTSGIQFIRDDWKAPFWSIDLPLRFMADATAKRKLIVIGTISDIFGRSAPKYRDVAEAALAAADVVYFYGANSSRARRARNVPDGKVLETFDSFRALHDQLKQTLEEGDLVLLKGSNGDHLARLALSYGQRLGCFRDHCRRQKLCDVCSLLTA